MQLALVAKHVDSLGASNYARARFTTSLVCPSQFHRELIYLIYYLNSGTKKRPIVLPGHQSLNHSLLIACYVSRVAKVNGITVNVICASNDNCNVWYSEIQAQTGIGGGFFILYGKWRYPRFPCRGSGHLNQA